MTTVSIVVPAYNNAEHIRETLESIFAQTHEDLEVIVADHSSTDGTRAVIEEFASDDRLTILDTHAGGGAPRNWNRVTERATGEYIKLVCGDDLLHPEIVAIQVRALEADGDIALVASRRSIVDANSRPVIAERGLPHLAGRVNGRKAIRATIRSGTNVFGEPACVMVRRSSLVAAGLWDPRFPYLIDEATYARVLLAGDLYAVPRALASFRISDTQWSVKLTNEQYRQASGFHQWVRDSHPEVISRWDVMLGNAAARANAMGRRAAYAVLKTRMSKSV